MDQKINLIAEKAVRRIARECAAAKLNGSSKHSYSVIAATIVGAAKDELDFFTTAALPAERLHNRINARLVQIGLARWDGAWLVAA